jgi:hypothetical protein
MKVAVKPGARAPMRTGKKWKMSRNLKEWRANVNGGLQILMGKSD